MLNVNGSLPSTQTSHLVPAQAPDRAQVQSSDLMPVSFTPPFFLREIPNHSPIIAASPGTRAKRHYYSKAVHGNYFTFRESPDYIKYQFELAQDVRFLKDFYGRQSMPDSGKIGKLLSEFYNNRFPPYRFIDIDEDEPSPFFGDLVYLIDSQGKQSLDRICDMVRDEGIPVEKRTAAIHNLALGLDVCGQGVVSNLIAAEGELAMSSDGIWAELWKAKQRIAEMVIRQAVLAKFCRRRDYSGNEIHWVNAVWNHVADKIGLIPRPDIYATLADESSFLEACRDTVLRAMIPDRFAWVIAEECLAMFSSRLAERERALSGEYSALVEDDCEVILQGILMHYRLPQTALKLPAFIWIDDTGTRYRVRTDATLVARAFLGVIRSEGLLTEASVAVNHGQWVEWVDRARVRHALLTFGSSLVWRADRMDTASDTLDWSLDTDAEQFTMRDLIAWWKECGSREATFPTVFPAVVLTAALRQAVDGVDPADIDDIPLIWLLNIQNLFIVLPHMTDHAADLCLQANVPYFKKNLSASDRADVIDHAMGRSTAILELADHPNAWALLSEPRGTLGRSRLQKWMGTNNGRAIGALLDSVHGECYLNEGTPANGKTIFKALLGMRSKPALNLAMAAGYTNATGAWFGLVAAPGVIDKLGKRLYGLLESRDADGGTALGQALAKGRTQSMEQFCDLLATSAAVEKIGKGMCGLLMAPVKAGVPGLLVAMENGFAGAVQVFHAILTAPTVLPKIKSGLFTLVRARGRRTGVLGFRAAGTTGLVQAMKYGCTNTISAFHVMLIDPRILPWIATGLRTLVTDKGQNGNGCLAMALEYGRANAIRAFHGMVADPSITPNIEDVLDEVVLARTREGQIGLGLALEAGHAKAIEAFHALVAAPAIRPFIARSIPELFAASRRDGTLSLSLAVRNDHVPAVIAFADMLEDPVLLPLVAHDLSRLISRVLDDLEKLSNTSNTSKSLVALQKGRSVAWIAFRLMVRRPEIAGCLDDKTRERLQVLEEEEQEPAAAPESARTTAGEVPEHGTALARTQSQASMMRRIVQRLTGNSHAAS